MRPLVQELTSKAKHSLSPKQKAYLRSTICNGQWPQARKHDAYGDVGMRCHLCQAAKGTLAHRHFYCEGTRVFREQVMPECVNDLVNGISANRMCEMLPSVDRGLLPYPATPAGIMPAPHISWRCGAGQGAHFEGALYNDGSIRYGAHTSTASAGWAVVQLNNDTNQITFPAIAYGRLPAEIQDDVDGAELYALHIFLRFALIGSTLHIVSAFVIN